MLLWTIIIEGGTGDVDGNKITCGSRAAGSLYVDNIRAVYGTTADDLENPVITSVRGGSSSLTGYSDLTELAEDGSTVLTDNELQFFTGYYDPQGENRTGVSAENTVITIDGQDIRNFANTDQAVTGTVTLPNGRHSIKVEIMDGFGNRASVTRSFTVKGTANIPTVTLDTPSYALVGENYVVSVTSPTPVRSTPSPRTSCTATWTCSTPTKTAARAPSTHAPPWPTAPASRAPALPPAAPPPKRPSP